MARRFILHAAAAACLLAAGSAQAQYRVENLGRGVVAVRSSETEVYVGWRLLGTDPAGIAFNVYRAAGDGPPVKLNASPLAATTDFVDSTVDPTRPNAYTVRPVFGGAEFDAAAPFILPAGAPVQQYLTIPLQRPAGGVVPVPEGNPTQSYTYSPNDASVADLDGDGEYEVIVKWDPSNARDSASSGLSANQLVDAYKLDGTRLWRIDLGRNIRSGASNWISKWDWTTATLTRLLTATSAASNNGTKANAAITADVLGDWREEAVWRASDNNSLRIYTTTIPAANRIYTLMHDPQYRMAIAWQNVAYNQPPHPGFFLGEGMADPPRPNIVHRDTGAPAFARLAPSLSDLWPPNHAMVPVTVDAAAVDLLDPLPTVRIISVTSNEPVDAPDDDGHTAPDWEITGALAVSLRAERSGVGTGRIYTIAVEASDAAGNTKVATVEVRVPLER